MFDVACFVASIVFACMSANFAFAVEMKNREAKKHIGINLVLFVLGILTGAFYMA